MRITREELPRPPAADFQLRHFCRSVLKAASTNAMWITYGLFTVMALVAIAKDDSAPAGSASAPGAQWTLVSEWTDAELSTPSMPPVGADREVASPPLVSSCADPAQPMELLESAPRSARCSGPDPTQTVSASNSTQ